MDSSEPMSGSPPVAEEPASPSPTSSPAPGVNSVPLSSSASVNLLASLLPHPLPTVPVQPTLVRTPVWLLGAACGVLDETQTKITLAVGRDACLTGEDWAFVVLFFSTPRRPLFLDGESTRVITVNGSQDEPVSLHLHRGGAWQRVRTSNG